MCILRRQFLQLVVSGVRLTDHLGPEALLIFSFFNVFFLNSSMVVRFFL